MDVDELYLVPPAEFIAARDELVRRLRAEGDRDGAAAVARRRRPTASVWAVNRLAHDDPDLVAGLLAAAADVDRAQRSSEGSALRDGSSRLRRLLDDARRRASALLEASGPAVTPQLQRRLDSTLQGAAASSAQTRQALLAGHLDVDVDPAGFVAEPVEDAAEVVATIAGRGRAADRGPSRDPVTRAPKREDRARLQAAVRSAEAALRQAQTVRDRAADVARRRREETAKLRAQADAAEAAARDAQERVAQLDAEAHQAAAALDRVRADGDLKRG